MFRRAAIVSAALVFAFAILGTSVFRASQPQYAFSKAGQASKPAALATPSATIDYYLPYPGILPDHFLWPLKALRDRIWLFLTTDTMRRAELLLLFADKRIRMAEELIKGGKTELGVSTATKAEKYLEQAASAQKEAAQKGADTAKFLEKQGQAALKHREILENLVETAPEEARPVLNQTIDYPKKVFEETTHQLNEQGKPLPISPF